MNSFLLPHRFKIIGLVLCPLGFLVWSLVQTNVLLANQVQVVRVSFLILSSISFVFGFFALVFSKEKTEDEYINQIRLKTFQLACIFQTVLILIIFFILGFSKELPAIDNQMFLFLGCIFFFYLFYIIRFNYMIHFKNLRSNEK